MTAHIAAEKQRLREALLFEHRAAGRDAALDARITESLTQSEIWREAARVFVYLPLGWEVDTRALIQLAFAQGKRVAVPISGASGAMEAVCIEKHTRFCPGRYGISEPETVGEILSPQDTSLIIVPALAFDRNGVRLGRGGGYYDRWLARTSGVSVGVCYGQYLFSALPELAHDRRVDAVCTQEGMLWTKS